MSENVPFSDANHTEPRRRSWSRLVLIGFLVVAAVLSAVVVFQEDVSPTQATADDPLNFAEVVITDLVQEETLTGELGSIEADPVKVQLEGTITAIAEQGDTVHQGEALFAIDDQPVVLLYGNLPSFRSIAVGEDTVTLANQLNGTITWVAERGTVLEQGDVLYRVDDRPVVVLYGEQPAYRSLGVAGPNLDVAAARAALSAAQANLAALTSPPSEQQIQAARQSITAAQQGLQDLLDLPDPAAVQIAEANLELVEISLQAAQAAYDQVANQPDVAMSGQAMTLWQATTNYELAQAQYNQARKGATPAQIASARAGVAQAQANLEALQGDPDTAAVAAAEAQVEQAQLALDALLSGPLSVDPTMPLAGVDVLQLKAALVALGYDPEALLTMDDEFTLATQQIVEAWQADMGALVDGIVDLGEVVFLPGPAQVLQVLATPGSQAASVVSLASGDPASGADVRQLEEALVALGFDAARPKGGRVGALVADGIHTSETTQAVLAFQEATGIEQDGIVDLGEVVFRPGAMRVTERLATSGSWVSAGTALLGVSPSDKVVRVDLPADEQGLLTVGDAVTVEMPDQTEVPATVVFVSQTATPSTSGPATFDVWIELDDPAVAEGLDKAPVDVIVVSDSVQDVMAIPVSALVALLEGGYAVEVDAGGGQTQLVAVEVGFFGSNNMIEITSAGLEPGGRVVVP